MRRNTELNSKRIVTRLGLGVFFSLILLGLSTIPVMASTYGSGNYGACQYGSCSISVSSNGSVSLNVTPSTGASCTIQSDTVSVLTDNSNGYSLTLDNSSTNTALTSGGNTIPATTGTFSSPTALTANTWGYRIDGVGSFGSGPTTAQTNVSPSSETFDGPPASSVSPDTIANTSGSADPAVNTTIWYGVCANTSTPNGSYTTQVTYTAVTN